MTVRVSFEVQGAPVPKQSYRATRSGHGYRDPRVTAWQQAVAWQARLAMGEREPVTGNLAVVLEFRLPDRRRRDCDNLSKGVLDSLNGIVYVDDTQVVDLRITKTAGCDPVGVTVHVEEL